MTEDRTSSEHVHRRTALRAGAATAAAAAAAVAATASGAQAAVGQPVVQGGSNVVGTATTVRPFSSGPTRPAGAQHRRRRGGGLPVHQQQRLRGRHRGRQQVRAVGRQHRRRGGGAAMAASAAATPASSPTPGRNRYALEATNLSEDDGDSGAISADGGLGAAVVAYNGTDEVPALVVGGGTVVFRDLILADGALAITYTGTATLFGMLSPSQPAITVAGTASLTWSGTATIAIDADVVGDADLAGACVYLTRAAARRRTCGAWSPRAAPSRSPAARRPAPSTDLVTLQLAIPAQLGMSADGDRRDALLARARGVVRADPVLLVVPGPRRAAQPAGASTSSGRADPPLSPTRATRVPSGANAATGPSPSPDGASRFPNESAVASSALSSRTGNAARRGLRRRQQREGDSSSASRVLVRSMPYGPTRVRRSAVRCPPTPRPAPRSRARART